MASRLSPLSGLWFETFVDPTGAYVEIGLSCDEPVEPVSASVQTNFAVSPGTLTGVRFQENWNNYDEATFVREEVTGTAKSYRVKK